MTAEPDASPPTRRDPLTKETVLRTAIAMADQAGAGAPSMRRLADRLGVKAMALYHHFRNKDVLLDGMVDLVFAEIELPSDGVEWQVAMRQRAQSMREVLLRHRWAIGLMDSRSNPGYATLRHRNAVIGRLRSGGFSIAGAAHAFSLLDSYIYGFTLQEISLPFDSATDLADVAESITDQMPDEFGHLAEMVADHVEHSRYTYSKEFDIGLDLILEGLRQRREAWL